MHTLGAVQNNAPHATGGHCWDDVAEAHEAPTSCATRTAGSPTSKFYARCAATYPETFDCGKDDYYNPYASASSYLGTHWNTASNKYLSTAEPSAWQVLPKPTPKFIEAGISGATIGGTTGGLDRRGRAGHPDRRGRLDGQRRRRREHLRARTTLGFPTARTKTGGYAKGRC